MHCNKKYPFIKFLIMFSEVFCLLEKIKNVKNMSCSLYDRMLAFLFMFLPKKWYYLILFCTINVNPSP